MLAMIAGAVVIVGYTVMGGFLAVSTTDLIQSIVMSIALVIIVFFGIRTAGGWDAVMNNAKSMAGYLSMTHLHDMATGGIHLLRPHHHFLNHGLGIRVFRNASHPSAVHGHRK